MPCRRSDPQLGKCVKGVTQKALREFSKGIKDLDVPALDPVDINSISLNNAGLKVKFDNVILDGLANSKINDFKMNLTSRKCLLDYTANLTMRGHYNMDGRIIVLPIQGDGDFKIYLTNMNFNFKYIFDHVEGPGNKKYWDVRLTKKSYKLDKTVFDFKNLYNGNQFLAETTLRFMNENWNLIMNDIAPPVVDQIINSCIRVAQKLFSKVPEENLFIP